MADTENNLELEDMNEEEISDLLDELLANSDTTVEEETPTEIEETSLLPTEGSEALLTAIVPDNMTITGNVELDSDIELYGVLHGDITCKNNVTLLGGSIEGNVKAAGLTLEAGNMEGDAEIAGTVILKSGTRLLGNLTATAFSAEAGAKLKGMIAIEDTSE